MTSLFWEGKYLSQDQYINQIFSQNIWKKKKTTPSSTPFSLFEENK